MRVLVLAFVVISISAFAANQKKPKPPDVQVVEIKARRIDGKITLDGRVRNAAGKPIRGLVLVFDFMATGKAVITTQKTQIEEEALQPGQEAAFHVELLDPVRAVQYEVRAFDLADRELRVANHGPFSIE